MSTRPNNSPPLPTSEPASIAAELAEARRRLAAAGIEPAGLEARLLVGQLLGMDSAGLIAHGDRALSAAQTEAVRQLVGERTAGRPIAYLLGRREFWSLPLQIDERCLIPRPETELLVERALQRIPRGPARVIDLGTGSGAIILALKAERPRIEAWGSDASAGALAVAAGNARSLGLPVHWFQGRWLEAVAPRPLFDVVVSNPPYIDPTDPHLERGDLRFEPRAALVADGEGLADLQAIVVQCLERLRRDGWVLLEHGHTQGPAVRSLLAAQGFADIATHRDPAGHDRVTEGRRPG
jgi:release factor glutamine methyltransferase